jgi:predicted SAM-dependent methyltransferase
MPVIDKHNFLQTLPRNTGSFTLDIGCGPRKRNPGYIGIDALDFEGVDLVGDVFEVLKEFPNGCVDAVFSAHFFEHIPGVDKLLIENGRILKPGGKVKIIVPHFSNPYFYSDYTHRNFFGLYSMSYLATENLFKRKVPQYQVDTVFQVTNVYMRFQSPFYIRSLFYRLYGKLINCSYYLKELYEENFSRLVYCYEIEYDLVKK